VERLEQSIELTDLGDERPYLEALPGGSKFGEQRFQGVGLAVSNYFELDSNNLFFELKIFNCPQTQ